MTRTEKNKIKKASKVLTILAYVMIILFIICFITVITLKITTLFLMLGMLLTPLSLGVIFNFQSLALQHKLSNYRLNFQSIRRRHKLKLLWEAVCQDNMDAAIEIFNAMPNDDSLRILGNGIITTYIRLKGNTEKQNAADERISGLYS